MANSILVIGPKSCGKTKLCLTLRGQKTRLPIMYSAGYDMIPAQTSERLIHLYDVSGDIENLPESLLQKISLVLAVWDSTSNDSIRELGGILRKTRERIGMNVPFLVVGTKSDLREKDTGLIIVSSKDRNNIEYLKDRIQDGLAAMNLS